MEQGLYPISARILAQIFPAQYYELSPQNGKQNTSKRDVLMDFQVTVNICCYSARMNYHDGIILKTGISKKIVTMLLLQSGDINMNPGPRAPKFPCQICGKAVNWTEPAVQCDNCDGWYHKRCMNMSIAIYQALEHSNTSWLCCTCGVPNFSSSFFTQDSFSTNSISIISLTHHLVNC